MARRPKPPPPAAGETDPRSLSALLERHLEWMQLRAYSTHTVENTRKRISRFIAWCEERSVSRAIEVTAPILEGYQRHLYTYRKKDGQPLAVTSQFDHLSPIRSYFKWLARHHQILFNPAAELDLPKVRASLPAVLSAADVEKVLGRTDLSNPLGVRDRAILETFYSTGIRRSELIQLEIYDLDMARGLLLVRQGKGGKDRIVPIGERALGWIDRYLVEVRPELAVRSDERTLFLSSTTGEALTPGHLTRMVRRYVAAAGLGKHGSCHLLRHSMATLMLENGADIRFIQQLLGHADLKTTQVYTQVSIRKLKEVHTSTHPARVPRKPEAIAENDEAHELLSSLAAEAEQEDD